MQFSYQNGKGRSQSLMEFGLAPELEALLQWEGEDEWTSEIRTDRSYIRWVQESLNKIMGLTTLPSMASKDPKQTVRSAVSSNEQG